ncbi:uncharacterized protein LDX57_010568 [Aspergillus melleus]|uniref:uncharacterized protein n=1 Tax=Aspergillus melleus TaxID=138277 RepID=UPI001E8DFCA9|nr:uncharacterized protein LDX57_010568 [Aspergillus melleus]KAH8432935.1 hypothetical protein LDX57_010568 [Aspergillus melleus]
MKVATVLVGLLAIATASRDKRSVGYSFKLERASSIWENSPSLDVGIFSYFRSSILNLNTHEYAQSLVTGKSDASNSSRLDIRQGKNGIQSLSADNISKMRAYSNRNRENVTFDIRYDDTTTALPNTGGVGFQFGPAQSDEWG